MTYWLFYEKDSALELFPTPSNMEITAFNKHLCIWNYVNVVRSESTFGVIWMNTFPFSYTLYFPFSGIDLLFHSRNFHVEMFDFFFFFFFGVFFLSIHSFESRLPSPSSHLPSSFKKLLPGAVLLHQSKLCFRNCCKGSASHFSLPPLVGPRTCVWNPCFPSNVRFASVYPAVTS